MLIFCTFSQRYLLSYSRGGKKNLCSIGSDSVTLKLPQTKFEAISPKDLEGDTFLAEADTFLAEAEVLYQFLDLCCNNFSSIVPMALT